MSHPSDVLFPGETPFPILPAVDHYAGSEKLMKKALQLQNELGPIFDIINDSDYDGWFIVEAEQDPAKANPLEYAIKARKYIKEKAHI